MFLLQFIIIISICKKDFNFIYFMFLGEMRLYIPLKFSFPQICHLFVVQEHMSIGDGSDDNSADAKLKDCII